MNTREFIAKVLPEQDNYLLYIARNKKSSWNENHDTIDSLCNAIELHDKTDVTVYLAVGSFANNVGLHDKTGRNYTQRKSYQATWYKALAADLDVDPENPLKYDSQKQAIVSLKAGCEALGIPLPMVVLSGIGVHVWWPLTEAITLAQWEALSLALRAAFTDVQVKYDTSKISEPAMVLRPVGAHHKKDPDNWKAVEVLIDQPAHPPSVFVSALEKYAGLVTNRAAPTGKKKKKMSALTESLLSAGDPIVLDDMKRCPQLAAIIASGGATDAAGLPVPEPFWRVSLGVAKFCEDPEAAAVMMSEGHPGFDREECIEKMEGWSGTGPPYCASFAEHCPEGCATCEHEGNVATPAVLTGGVATIQSVNPDTGKDEELKLPKGYMRKQKCIFYTHPTSGEEIFVAPYVMWIAARVSNADENTNSAKIIVQFPQEGEKEISVDSSIIAVGGNDLRKKLADAQVYIKGNIDPLRNYLMTYLRELQNAAAADIAYRHFGWQNDGTFLTGDEVIGAKRETNVHLEGAAQDLAPALVSKGAGRIWTSASKIWDYPGLEMQNFVVSLLLGAPLMAGSTIKAALVNMYGKTGSGKSLAGKFGISAWGDPGQLMSHAKDTPNSLYKKLGTLSNCGGYIDEMRVDYPPQLKSLVMTLQDGKEKGRLKHTADGMRHAAEWQMPVVTSSNQDLYEVLKTNMNSGAEELRMLQLTCSPLDIFAKGTSLGRTLDDTMHRNYGFAGPALVREIISKGGPEAVLDRAREQFENRYGTSVLEGQERFFEVMLHTAYKGGAMAKELGLIEYDPMRGVSAVVEEIQAIRGHREADTLDGIDTMFQFLTSNQDKIVYYHMTPSRSFVLQPTPRAGWARIELELDDNDNVVRGMVYINRKAFGDWGTLTGAQYRQMATSMVEEGVDMAEGVRKTIFKGVAGAASTGQTYCFAVDLMSHPRLIAAYNDGAEAETLTGRKRLEEVK